jgi:hypothetical protein
MSFQSTDVEARIHAVLTERLGETAMVMRFHRHNDMVYLEVAGRLGLERTAKAVEQALESIGSYLRSEKISLDVTISSPWQPRWQAQEFGRGEPEQAVPCVARRR